MNTSIPTHPGPFAVFRGKQQHGRGTWAPRLLVDQVEYSLPALLERTRTVVVTFTETQVQTKHALNVLVSLNWQNAVQLLGAAPEAEAILRLPLMPAASLVHCWHVGAPLGFRRAVLLLAALDMDEKQIRQLQLTEPIGPEHIGELPLAMGE